MQLFPTKQGKRKRINKISSRNTRDISAKYLSRQRTRGKRG